MSVMQVLKETAGQGNNMPSFSEGRGNTQQMQDMEAMMMTAPIPGQSLTQNPESRLPYEQPPKFTDVQEFIDETFIRFTDEEKLPMLLDSMRMGLPVEHVAEKYLKKAMQKGDISPDLLMLSIEPTIYMLIALGTYAEVDMVLYPEDEMLEDEERPTETQLYRQASQDLRADAPVDNKVDVKNLERPAVAPKSLLSRAEDAVSKVKPTGESYT